jgi:membrane-associated phospholipid phosphatase
MLRNGLSFWLFLYFIPAVAQPIDTVVISNKINITSLVVISSGLSLQPYFIRHSIQESIQDRFGLITSNLDDYLQFSPIIMIYSYDLFSKQPASEWARQSRHLIISEVATLGTVYMLKKLTHVARPNGGSSSFPSGHTAQAFIGASIFHLSLKEKYPLWSYVAYVPATAVGMLRVLKNKHWSSDVLVGAGIAILVSHMSYSLDIWRSQSTGRNDTTNVKLQTSTDGLALVWRF